jgi:hypothetical protein
MAYENIELPQSNFCFGPQTDTICTIDTSNLDTVLRVKDTGGSNLMELTLSSNIVSDVVRLEYVGPRGLSSMLDSATFLTFEKVNDTRCMIKRWLVRLSYNELLLKEQVVKQTSGYEYYNASDFAVEYHSVTFTAPNENYNYIDISSATNIKAGTRLFLGPSTDADNYDETEYVTVHHVASYLGGTRVYLNSFLTNQYASGDPITYYSYVYVFSSIAYGGDSSKGSLYKLDGYTWSTIEVDSKSFYNKVEASRWYPASRSIASVIGTNMLFVSPYNYYLNWKSMFLNNVHQDKVTVFPVYDVIFNNYTLYKLQDRITMRFDDGSRVTEVWDTYNYQADTLLPYSNSMTVRKNQTILTGYHKNVDLDAVVRDQFHVGLRDKEVEFAIIPGDTEALLDPLNGVVTTDSNGVATVSYRSGSTYYGHTDISATVGGGSSSTGSVYVWGFSDIISFPYVNPIEKTIFQLKELSADVNSITQITDYYTVIVRDEIEGTITWSYPSFYLRGKSFFTTPGGDWGPYVNDYPGLDFYSPAYTRRFLPMLYQGANQIDGAVEGSFEVESWPYDEFSAPDFVGNQLKLIEDFDITTTVHSLLDFEVEKTVTQPDETFSRLLSQLKMGHYTHWVDGVAYDYLWTYDNVDQFIFVEDAVPQFWSEKNPISTDIWLRLRPYAFSLNASTLRFWVREVSYLGDTGYVDVTGQVSVTGFDAGGGLIGLELDYDPTENFHYGAIVFVRIEVYDVASEPNFIYVEYWFKVVPDYKAPYLLNLSPDREDEYVSTDGGVYLEIKDDGTGIDEDSIEILINSIRVSESKLTIDKVSRYYFKITYTPDEPLFHNKAYKITVRAKDTSPAENALNDSYRFYTEESSGIEFVNTYPGACKRGMQRFEDVRTIALSNGDGIDEDSIRLQVYNKDVTPIITPIIYRVS